MSPAPYSTNILRDFRGVFPKQIAETLVVADMMKSPRIRIRKFSSIDFHSFFSLIRFSGFTRLSEGTYSRNFSLACV